ncbi:MAG: ABC transporter permease [Saccharofermentanales bacterium]|jgi:NitT/TauT family transport system permease protein|nr:ABC transporter permease subunit [Bacillota bacterium]
MRFRRRQQKIFAVLFWLAVWGLFALLVGQELLVPQPYLVLERLWLLAGRSSFYLNLLHSLYRICLGFLLGTVLGAILAYLTTANPWAGAIIEPLMSVIRSTPIASIIILLLIWLSPTGVVISCVVLIVLPVMWSNFVAGINYRDPQLEEVADLFGFSRWKRWRYLRVPAILPFFFAAVQTGLGFAWKAGVAAEVLSIPRHAIGTRLYDAKIYLETADLFAWTFVVILLSIALEKSILMTVRRAGRYLDRVK